jgi:hypothetical protein
MPSPLTWYGALASPDRTPQPEPRLHLPIIVLHPLGSHCHNDAVDALEAPDGLPLRPGMVFRARHALDRFDDLRLCHGMVLIGRFGRGG